MGNDTDKTTANKQMKNDTGNSLKHEECEEDETTSFDGDNEDDNDMAVAHLSAICEEFEDLGNKSRGSYYDDKTAFVQAEGTPNNKGDEEDHSDDVSDGEPEEAEANGGNAAVLSTDTSVMNTQQESSCEYGANRELVVDQTIASTDYASQQSSLVRGSTAYLTATPADQTTMHCVVSNNGNSMEIVGDTLPQVMVYNVEITPSQDHINLLAKQPHQQPPLANHLNNQGIGPNDGNDVEQVENLLIFAPSLMNVEPSQMIMDESPIFPFHLQLQEEGVHPHDREETGTEDGEQSVSSSSEISDNIDDRVEYLELQ